jgi:hypothetical protein
MMRVEQLTPRELEYKDVKFTAKISKYDNCCCDGCFRLGRVTKIIMPETKHYKGGELKTTYSSYWFCESCMTKLKAAIENPPQEVKT